MENRKVILLSIVIPIYNCFQYLEDSIKSILEQADEKTEIILVNDGSTDKSGIICRKLSKQYQNVILIDQKNHGVSCARNNGLTRARGQYVVFADADDQIDIALLLSIIEMMNMNPSIDMAIYGLTFDYYYQGVCYRSDAIQPALEGLFDAEKWAEQLYELFRSNSLSPVWNKIFVRKKLIENNLYLKNDMFIYEDLEFSLRAMACCEKILFCRDIVYHYRQVEDEGNAGRRLARIESLGDLIAKIQSALDELGFRKNLNDHKSITKILTALYCILAQEKIRVSSKKTIRQICKDYSEWIADRVSDIPEENKAYSRLLANQKVNIILIKRCYTSVRHLIAVKIKNSSLYNKFRR